jgi:hypothetical protein
MATDDVMLSLANKQLSNELQDKGHFIWQPPLPTPAPVYEALNPA